MAFDRPGIGRPICFMLLQSVFFFSLMALIESGVGKGFWKKMMTPPPPAGVVEVTGSSDEELQMGHTRPELDSDVIAEKQRITNTTLSKLDDTLVFNELKKVYNGHFLAVDGLSLGVPMGECFGLLGVNGAGKTTTFKMLTGDENITSGEAYVDGFSVTTDLKEVR